MRLTARILIASSFAILSFMPGAKAEPYCQVGQSVEYKFAGQWYGGTVERPADNMQQCFVRPTDGSAPTLMIKERLRPVGGGVWDSDTAEAQAALAARPTSTIYCQPGTIVEYYWVNEWHRAIVEGAPDMHGDCFLRPDDGYSAPSRMAKSRIRPVGGGEWTMEAADAAPAQNVSLAADATPVKDAPTPAMEEKARAAYEKLMSFDPTTPAQTGGEGPVDVGVYKCSGDIVGEDTASSFGIIDDKKYGTYDGDSGEYAFDEEKGQLTMTSGSSKGLKYMRTSQKTFRVLKEDGSLTGINCVFAEGKDPKSGKW